MDLNNEAAKIMGYEFENLVAWVPTSKKHLKQFPIYPWNPIEDLGQCFAVVEKIGGYCFDLCDYVGPDIWYASFFDEAAEYRYEGSGKTPNEAILKAAIKAVAD